VAVNIACVTSLKLGGHGVEKARFHGGTLRAPTSRLRSGSVIGNTSCPTRNEDTGRVHTVPNASALPSRPPQNIHIRSTFTGKVGVVCAVFRLDSNCNYISHRIVRRLSIATCTGPSPSTSTLVTGGTVIIPTHRYCDLVSTTEGRNNHDSYRFHIVKDGPLKFDIMLGSAFVASCPLLPQRIQLAEFIRPIP